MDFLIILLISISLSFDSFAISISSGLAYQEISFKEASKIAITLAIFQTIMPIIGWLLGEQVKIFIENFDHWIAFTLLSILGIKIIYEAFKKEDKKNFNPMKTIAILTMAIATSIDAFAIGFTIALIKLPIIISSLTIGFVTYIVSMLGILIGKKTFIKNKFIIDILGGTILILIGIKILLEHLNS